MCCVSLRRHLTPTRPAPPRIRLAVAPVAQVLSLGQYRFTVVSTKPGGRVSSVSVGLSVVAGKDTPVVTINRDGGARGE